MSAEELREERRSQDAYLKAIKQAEEAPAVDQQPSPEPTGDGLTWTQRQEQRIANARLKEQQEQTDEDSVLKAQKLKLMQDLMEQLKSM